MILIKILAEFIKIYKLIIIFAIKIQRTKFSLNNIEENFKSWGPILPDVLIYYNGIK